MKPLGMTARHPQQPRHCLFTHLHQPSWGPHATAFVEMVDDVCSCGLRELGIKQRAPATLGKFFTAGTTAQQPDAVTAISFADDEIALTRLTKPVAFRVHTG
jgi:hypothetical protein